ncbi:hypothetical protein K466DRAFT_56620 [Polyporus arcularius HHB13444]|uniref:F-box domain-containing protein n=1 Tax=Polyporus arcularius HHB13444 TaxID=1314778 RepID=A0A5C3PGS4_9APHY|nr:hypothetical protein K466DRAFT_56620 [Polyporus arcularius HHB13444]
MGKQSSANGPVPVRQRKQKELGGTRAGTSASASSSSPGDSMVGKLSLLLTMPLDVFFEVASHLKPVDLLHLARVSSAFRKMLLSRSSRRIWIAARNNIVPEIPDGPDDLSEPRYARLLFERDCTNCGATGAEFLDYANYHRFCSTCWSSSVRPGGQLAYDSGFYYDPDFKKVIYDLLPGVPGGAYQAYQHAQAWRGPFSIPENNKQTEHTFYHRSDFAAVTEEYRQVRAGETNISMKQFVAKHKARTQARLLFQVEIIMVELDRRQARAVFEHHMTDRKLAIAEKLRELDYDPEDYPATDPDFHSLLDQRAALTPRIWHNIKPKLIEMLQAERTRRADDAFHTKWFMRMQELQPIYDAFVQVVKGRDSTDVWASMMPAFGAAVKLPSMRALITSASPTEHLIESDFAAIRPALMRDVRAAMLKIQHHCANVLREAASRVSHASTSTAGTHKGKGKGKGKARDVSETILGPEIDLEDLFADDPAAADRALLDRPTSLFECVHPSCLEAEVYGVPRMSTAMTFLGVLEHDATYHTSPSWDTIPVRPAGETTCALMPRLLDSLGMPRGTTLSALHQRLSDERPSRCSCGMRFYQPPHVIGVTAGGESYGLSHLLQHISGQWHPLVGYNLNVYNQNTVHNITLEPKPNAYAHQAGMPAGQMQIGGIGPMSLQSLLLNINGLGGMHPLGIMQRAQLASHAQTAGIIGLLQFNAPVDPAASAVPVGPSHPFVQAQMHALAGMLNQPGAIVGAAREVMKSRKRR